MAIEKSMFFDSIQGDRKYSADDFARFFRGFLTNGIKDGGSNLLVEKVNNSMRVKVNAGIGIVRGYYFEILPSNESGDMEDFTLAIEATGDVPRIDRVMLRLDLSNQSRSVKIVVEKGQPTIPPTLKRGNNLFDLSLAQIKIPANASSLNNATIIDERFDKTYCGLISALTVDGAGSGLDADMLDGKNGDYYLDYNNLVNKPAEPEQWQNLTLEAGITSYYPNETIKFLKDGSGVVRLSGTALYRGADTTATWTNIGQLPSGYRPKTTMSYSTVFFEQIDDVTINPHAGFVTVSHTGLISIQLFSGEPVYGKAVSLAPIIFYAEN